MGEELPRESPPSLGALYQPIWALSQKGVGGGSLGHPLYIRGGGDFGQICIGKSEHTVKGINTPIPTYYPLFIIFLIRIKGFVMFLTGIEVCISVY